jgi:hypothetical protein
VANAKRDVNVEAANAVRRLTEIHAPRGEDLIGDPEMRKKYVAAKKREKSRRARR